MIGYTDANQGGDPNELKSILRYTSLLNNDAISLNSKKQIYIALSTIEANFIACIVAIQEVIWLKRLLHHLKIISDVYRLVLIFYDN